ncbi:MAG: translation initiation factor IF-2 [Candidatus Omnitrophota bacterium]
MVNAKKEKPAAKKTLKKAVVKSKVAKAAHHVAAKKPLAKSHAVKPAAAKPSKSVKTAGKVIHAHSAPAHKPVVHTAQQHPAAHPVVPQAAKPVHVAAPKPAQIVTPKPVHPAVPKPAHHAAPEPAKHAPIPVPVAKPVVPAPVAEIELKELELEFPITVKDLAIKLQEKSSTVIKHLMAMRVMAGLNQTLEESVVSAVCQKYGFKIKKALDEEESVLHTHAQDDSPAALKARPPVVTIMGHVDHGKTSLLDAIRKSKVAEGEHGGITQHIGAYRVILPHGEITFLDTPGHEAFTAMRARGAGITDIVVLVVAADDGIMPQTVESIDHARAAGVSIIVAVNKIDKPQADLDRVKKQLAELNLMAEDWGGKTITVPVSAKTGEGIDNLLEMILLEAQMLELKANPLRQARGVVVEAKISKGRGPVATLLVQNGTLRLNESIIVGNHYGKIRAMFDDHGRSVTAAGPAFPVEVLGLSGVAQAGEPFFSVKDEKQARDLAFERQEKERLKQIKSSKKISLEDLYTQIKEGKLKELKIIIKADVQGSLEAINQTLNKLNVSEIKLNFIHEAVGSINSSDVILAVASDALILGFNVMPDEPAKELISKEGIDVRTYNIIYELANDIKAAIEGMLEPKLKKTFLGKVEVRKVFRLSRSGMVAGCFVTKGKVTRSSPVSLVRNGSVIFEGNLSSLKRFKDDVREVAEGFECGITLAGFDAVQEGDIIEAHEIQKIARTL